MPKLKQTYEHNDRYGTPIVPDSIVAFCYSGGNQIHLGRVVSITAKRVRIAYSYEYTNYRGERSKWSSRYQARPQNVLVLNNIEQNLTMLALKGLV